MAWLCDPVLAAAELLVIYRLTLLPTADRAAAGMVMVMVLALASPAFVINAMSFYSMTAHLLCNAAFGFLLLQPTARRAAVAELIGGLSLTLHNPPPHMRFAVRHRRCACSGAGIYGLRSPRCSRATFPS